MIVNLLPTLPQILYLKMESALAIEGYLNGLKELLDELETNSKSQKAFGSILKKLQNLKSYDSKNFNESIKWINDQLELICKGNWHNLKIKKLVLERLKYERNLLEDGKKECYNYLGDKFNLLKRYIEYTASFGEFEVVKSLGETITINISLGKNVDPLKSPITQVIEILPDNTEAKPLLDCLKNGFIKAMVMPPAGEVLTNRYFIDQGKISIAWPIHLRKALSLNTENWRLAFDLSVARCLQHLLLISNWRDCFEKDNFLVTCPSDNHLNKFYNHFAMEQYLTILSRGNQDQIRSEIKAILDRFLILLLQEMTHSKSKKNQKERAENYAYGRIKTYLLPIEKSRRSESPREKVREKIMQDSNEEDLNFTIKESHCVTASKLFDKNYGWPGKRGKDLKPRLKKGK